MEQDDIEIDNQIELIAATKDNSQDTKYQVLARKYRPTNFDDLIGQDVLVKIITNSIKTNRIAHAFLLTGIRGVGKTTTARIVAKTLNCSNVTIANDGENGEFVQACGKCYDCVSIAQDRHPDVIEMDAASRTGVGDIREIIDNVKYAPNSAKYKIYIIDEVHMLSNNAFNALLKTLEEPPEHVKFIFATTEIKKIPITILSRCQKFDLKRINQELLFDHLNNICQKEHKSIDEKALSLIVREAGGSVRDGLSLLDQAISYDNAAHISEDNVRNMIGIQDKLAIFELLKNIFSNNLQDALEQLQKMYFDGSDPVIIINDMLEIINIVTKISVDRKSINQFALSPDEIKQSEEFADKLSINILSRAWQILLKGINELQNSPSAIMALEMLIIRLGYLSNSPPPEKLISKLQNNINNIGSSNNITSSSEMDKKNVEKNLQ
ncbi:MAG: DNA polymerase III subunit gamma/tau, partial [Pseudomonadota bacterium]